jgi:UDP:flavonoid glycosyltransferase YjiC (YdhE family)
VVGPPALAPLVAETGHPFEPGGEPPEEDVRPIREQLPVLPAEQASVLGNRELFGRLAKDAMLEPLEQVVVEWRPDIILRDPCEYASAVVGARLGIATPQVAIGLAEVEWASIQVAAPALERHDGVVERLRQSTYLTRFPASLDPSPFGHTRRFREPPPAAASALPDWWGGSDAPLVYVSFGTVLGHMTHAGDVYRGALAAAGALDARVLMTVGHRFDLSELGDVPANVHVEAWVDQSRVLGQADLVVCHGGSGTTFGALAAVVPVVMVPLFADQFANGISVSRAGAGLVVEAAALREGIPRAAEAVLADRSYREAAMKVAAEMAAAAPIDTVLQELAWTSESAS